jgi:tetratricopeptide (TPR) repeat protein
LGALLATTCAASAQQGIVGYPGVEGFDRRELALLPEWCIYTDTFRDRVAAASANREQMVRHWRERMGPTFDAMHHYCYGLMKTNRATLLARDPVTREFYLRDAITEFEYVIDHAAPGFVLLPDLLARKGENLLRLGLGRLALTPLEHAIELNATHWPAYIHLSDYYKEAGDRKAARDWLDKGLAHAPGNAALLRRIEALEQSPAAGSPRR